MHVQREPADGEHHDDAGDDTGHVAVPPLHLCRIQIRQRFAAEVVHQLDVDDGDDAQGEGVPEHEERDVESSAIRIAVNDTLGRGVGGAVDGVGGAVHGVGGDIEILGVVAEFHAIQSSNRDLYDQEEDPYSSHQKQDVPLRVDK